MSSYASHKRRRRTIWFTMTAGGWHICAFGAQPGSSPCVAKGASERDMDSTRRAQQARGPEACGAAAAPRRRAGETAA